MFSYLPTWVPLESEREAFEEVRALYQWKKLDLGKDEAEAFFSAPVSKGQWGTRVYWSCHRWRPWRRPYGFRCHRFLGRPYGFRCHRFSGLYLDSVATAFQASIWVEEVI